MPDTDREFDVIVWGATGFTGGLVAEYLAEAYGPDELDWAIAGRNRQKLDGVRRDLADACGAAGDVPVVLANAFDRQSLEAMAARTSAICTTVGPYSTYGEGLVEACVDQETDYCDLSGELPWIRRMQDRFHDEAVERGVRIVNCCGFDSIPSDLGTYVLQQRARETYGAPCRRVKLIVEGIRGDFSGGTLASMATVFEEAKSDRAVRRTVADPYSLNPAGERDGPDSRPQQGVRWDDDLETWTGPFVMAAINERVVRRTNALLDYPYGDEFRYGESSAFGRGLKGAASAAGFTAGQTAFIGAMAFGPTRSLVQSFLPEPGEGPSREEIENGYFRVRLLGRGRDSDDRPFKLEVAVSADRDPGYGATATMLGESAVALAGDEIDEGLDGGLLTPASALGGRLVKRLRDAGMTFET